jgi:glycosyltransferase involved in cell wall biosynthesis
MNTTMLARQIRSSISRSVRPIVWIFLPAHVGIVGKLNEKLVIYHCVDDHSANPNVPANTVIEREGRLLKLADLVFTSSSTLYESKRAFNPNTFYLPNVADTGLFAQARTPALEIADDMKNIPRPIAGFIGNVTAYKLDFDLIQNIAKQNPDWSFVFIGPIGRGDPSTDVSQLAALKNIFLLGARAYHELPRYVKAFDACLIPFRENDSTRSTLPMKFFEYLAAGKPVIATELPTLADFRDCFYSVRDAREWSAALERARREDSALAKSRVDRAQKYSWDARMVEIEKLVETALRKNQGAREPMRESF